MPSRTLRRRRWSLFVLATLGLLPGCGDGVGVAVNATALKVPDTATPTRYDFDDTGVDDWNVVEGRWGVEEMAGAPSGTRVLVQRAVENEFNVIVAPAGAYTDVETST